MIPISGFHAAAQYLHFPNNKVSFDNLAFKLHYRGTFSILLISTILVTSRAMLQTFSAASKYLQLKKRVTRIDNAAFKFHYRASFLILLIATILVTSRQYIGEHIKCITGSSAVPEHVMNTFCFFTTTFTIVRHMNESLLQSKVIPHPGIGPLYEEDTLTYHAYYQWVPFVLFGQCLMFYITHLFWKKWEGGNIKALVDGLHMIALSKYINKTDLELSNLKIPSTETVNTKIRLIKRAFYSHVKSNPFWGYKLMFCEVLNLFNVVLQIYITDRFLGNKFLHLGIDFLKDDFKGEMNVLDVVFPKVTKCHFYKYGASGSIQKHDALCVMALNVINEKVFIFLWFWYVILLIVSFIAIIWRIITVLYHSTSNRFNHFLYSTIDKQLNPWDVLVVTKQFSLSDWLFLYYIAVNLEPYVFRNIFIQIANEIRTPTNTTSEEGEESDISDILEKQQARKVYYAPGNTLDFENENQKLTIDTPDGPALTVNTEDHKFDTEDNVKHVKFA